MVTRYGDGWTHMHHYCYALVDNMRLDRYSARNNPCYASWPRALANIDYVLRNTDTTRDFPFRQEALARKARLLARFSDPAAALATAGQLMAEWPTIPGRLHHGGRSAVARRQARAGTRAYSPGARPRSRTRRRSRLQRSMLKLN